MTVQSMTTRALTLALFAVSCQAAPKDAAPAVVQEPAPAAAQEAAPPPVSFNDQDRQATRDWYQQHQRSLGAGWRQQDRLPPALQVRLRAGQRLDPDLRQRMHPLPSDLEQHYRPAPHGYHYAVIGGNVVLVDDNDEVHDVFGLSIQVH